MELKDILKEEKQSYTTTSARITVHDLEFMRKHGISFSKLVRESLRELKEKVGNELITEESARGNYKHHILRNEFTEAQRWKRIMKNNGWAD